MNNLPPPDQKPGPVTIVDVAQKAGYSHSTVSRVLNNHPNVKTETRRLVMEAVEDLGYVANLQARGLAGGRLGVIGLVVIHLEATFLVEIVRAIDRALADAGYDFMLCTTYRRERAETSYVTQLSGGLVDGLIVLLPSDAERYASQLSARDFPFVLLDYGANPLGSSVSTDNMAGARIALEHLKELGHHRIGCVTGNLGIYSGRTRTDGFNEAIRQLGLDDDPDLVVEGDFGELRAAKATHQLMELATPPTAIFTSADTAAVGVIDALQDRGLRVPDHVSVVGYDNIPESALTDPPLTTIDQNINKLGFRAVERLLELLEEPALPACHLNVPVELVIRRSTGPLSRAGGPTRRARPAPDGAEPTESPPTNTP